MATPALDEVMKMFNIDSKKPEESDEEIYSNIKLAQEDFNSKISEVTDIIREASGTEEVKSKIIIFIPEASKTVDTEKKEELEIEKVVEEPKKASGK